MRPNVRATLLDLLAVAIVAVVVGAFCFVAFVFGQHKVDPYRQPPTNHPTITREQP